MTAPELRKAPLYSIGQNGQSDQELYLNNQHKHQLLERYRVYTNEIYEKPEAPPSDLSQLEILVNNLGVKRLLMIGECIGLMEALELDPQTIELEYPCLEARQRFLLAKLPKRS